LRPVVRRGNMRRASGSGVFFVLRGLEIMSLIGQPVTILGAGVAGLAVARALALHGAQVTVLEQADAVREVGAGLQVSPNGAAVLKALGLEAALEAASMRARAVELRDGLDGSLVTRLEVARLRPEQGYHFLHRADLIQLLLDGARAAGVDLRLLQRVDRVYLSGARPKVVMSTGAEVEVPLLIGADGLHSPTRAALNGKVAPFFTRQVAWRTLIPCEPDAAPVAEVHMGPGRHLVSYPLRGGTLAQHRGGRGTPLLGRRGLVAAR
jgi:salicylate hydroxylase